MKKSFVFALALFAVLFSLYVSAYSVSIGICMYDVNGTAISGDCKNNTDDNSTITNSTDINTNSTDTNSTTTDSNINSTTNSTEQNLTNTSLNSTSFLKVISPINGSYNSSFVLFSLSSEALADFSVLNSGWHTLCLEKTSCNKKLRLPEGQNNLTIRARDYFGNVESQQVSLFIDTKKPVISKTLPVFNSLTNGSLFSIKYTEENLKNITLYYGLNGAYSSLTQTCESGKNKVCFFNPDISGFNTGWFEYWFSISDGARVQSSRITTVKIDTLAPKILFNSTYILGKKVNFIFDIQEDNFKKIYFEDTNSCGLMHKASALLCSNLRAGRCSVSRNFCSGDHNLTIIILDKAGNSATSNINFNIV